MKINTKDNRLGLNIEKQQENKQETRAIGNLTGERKTYIGGREYRKK